MALLAHSGRPAPHTPASPAAGHRRAMGCPQGFVQRPWRLQHQRPAHSRRELLWGRNPVALSALWKLHRAN
eukprot:1528429-Prymnesium_polylepis.1